MNSRDEEKIEWPTPIQEAPGIHMSMVMALVAGALLFFAFASLLTWVVERHERRQVSPDFGHVPRAVGDAQINEVNQQQFTLETRAYDEKAREERRLHSYGWVDRAKGVIHIPVERAQQLVLKEQGGEQRKEGAR